MDRQHKTKISDFDGSDKLRLDNVFLFKNDGWGIKVDAAEGALSTSRIHVNRCNIERNKSGGIQWTGQGGTYREAGFWNRYETSKWKRWIWYTSKER